MYPLFYIFCMADKKMIKREKKCVCGKYGKETRK